MPPGSGSRTSASPSGGRTSSPPARRRAATRRPRGHRRASRSTTRPRQAAGPPPRLPPAGPRRGRPRARRVAGPRRRPPPGQTSRPADERRSTTSRGPRAATWESDWTRWTTRRGPARARRRQPGGVGRLRARVRRRRRARLGAPARRGDLGHLRDPGVARWACCPTTSRASTRSSWAAGLATCRPGWPGAAPGPWASTTRPSSSRRRPGSSASTASTFPLHPRQRRARPLPDASFDFAISEYGAVLWADPTRGSRRRRACCAPAAGCTSSRTSSSSMVATRRGRGRGRPARGAPRPAATSACTRVDWPDEHERGVPPRARRVDPAVPRQRASRSSSCSSRRRPRAPTTTLRLGARGVGAAAGRARRSGRSAGAPEQVGPTAARR